MAHVLVHKDHPANLELMVYRLQASGHAPRTPRNARSGLGTGQGVPRPIEPEALLRKIEAGWRQSGNG
jgi:hypothetical protein